MRLGDFFVILLIQDIVSLCFILSENDLYLQDVTKIPHNKLIITYNASVSQ